MKHASSTFYDPTPDDVTVRVVNQTTWLRFGPMEVGLDEGTVAEQLAAVIAIGNEMICQAVDLLNDLQEETG